MLSNEGRLLLKASHSIDKTPPLRIKHQRYVFLLAFWIYTGVLLNSYCDVMVLMPNRYDTIFEFCFVQIKIRMGSMFPSWTFTHQLSCPWSGKELEALVRVRRMVETLAFWMQRSNVSHIHHLWQTTCCRGSMAMMGHTLLCSYTITCSLTLKP